MQPKERAPLFNRATIDLVVMASSTGGIGALRTILDDLGPDFPVPIAIVQHISDTFSALASQPFGLPLRLPASFAKDGQRLRAGSVYLAPGNHHMVISTDRRLRLLSTKRVNHVRPSADPLFESASEAFGKRVLAVVLSGRGRDGAAGARTVKSKGGLVFVQAPSTAEAKEMPYSAMLTGCVDLVIPLALLGRAITLAAQSSHALALLGLPRRLPIHFADDPSFDRRTPLPA